MTSIASHITVFFRERLPIEQASSPHTCSNYAYTFMLLFDFANKQLKISPSSLHLEHIDAPLVLAFLAYIETTRANCPVPAMSDWPGSSLLCASWNIGGPPPWSRSGLFWQFPSNGPIRNLFIQPGIDPDATGDSLTLGTVTVPAGIVGLIEIIAGITDIDMIPEIAGATVLDVKHDLMLL